MAITYIYLSKATQEHSNNSAQLSAQRYLEALSAFRSLYTSEVVSIADQTNLKITHNYKEYDNAIPLPATLTLVLGEKIGQTHSGAKAYLYSNYPFPWRSNESQKLFQQDFIQQAWQQLNKNPNQPFFRFEEVDGIVSIRYAIADVMRETCVDCHNNHPQTPKNNWEIGDVRGVMEVILPVSIGQKQTQSSLQSAFIALAIMSVVVTLVLFLFVNRIKKDTNSLRTTNRSMALQQKETDAINIRIIEANKELCHKSQELERSNLIKSEFLATMSHEIRTPINGVIGMLTLLNHTQLNEKQLHHTHLASTCANALLSLINDVLDFSKIEAGKLSIELIDFNIIDLIAEFATTMAQKAQEKNIEFIIDVTQINYPMVKGDPNRIRQIMTNLVNNAIKFTPQGEVTLKAQLEKCSDNSLTLHCDVTDTGIGIPEDKLHTMFERFTQADSSTTREYGGSGLGLAIVVKLCELMGGKVDASSVLDQGSTFSFSIKLDESTERSIALPHLNIDSRHFLVVDDNRTNREVLTGQLDIWGASVTEAASGDIALALLEQSFLQQGRNIYDVAIIDMQMPYMDGAELGQRIKQNKKLSTMKLIMMTSLAEQGDVQFFANIGFDCYFAKPAAPSDIYNAIAIVIEGGEALNTSTPLLTKHHIHQLTRTSLPKGTQVLLVEDNSVNQIVAEGMLQNLGAVSDLAVNGKEALMCLENKHYDLVLMDCQMPIMDGYKATKAIRQSDRPYKDIYIIAMTANALLGDKEKCFEAGMNEYLSKPVDISELETKILNALATITDSELDVKIAPAEASDAITIKQAEPFMIDSEVKPAWDKANFYQRVSNNQILAEKIIAVFCEEMPIIIKELEQAVKSKDYHEISNIAHSIKGSSSNVAAIELADLAFQIGEQAKLENDQNIDLIIQTITTSFDALILTFLQESTE
ncbi:MAG: response regulator [Psychromonas sp.]|nr:response regulator [Psychromonas sp.]